MRNNVRVFGIEDVLRRLDRQIGEAAIRDVDRITETYARKMAQESADMAPVKDGGLRGSLASSPEVSDDSDHVWEWGSDLPYANRQEYEHATHKGFARKAVWNNREDYRKAVKKRVTGG